MQALLVSDDVRSTALFVGACMAGFIFATPSPSVVRIVFVAAATYGVAMWVLRSHSNSEDSGRRNDNITSFLMASGRKEKPGSGRQKKIKRAKSKNGPFATMLHPEASAAIASLYPLSRPGYRAAVHAVVVSTENVARAYHETLRPVEAAGVPSHPPGAASACIDDLRDCTLVALDALQVLRMETGSRGRASEIAASAEQTLRGLFVRFRQIAASKLQTPQMCGAPYASDMRDDYRFVR